MNVNERVKVGGNPWPFQSIYGWEGNGGHKNHSVQLMTPGNPWDNPPPALGVPETGPLAPAQSAPTSGLHRHPEGRMNVYIRE